jgi:hypothetical protein
MAQGIRFGGVEADGAEADLLFHLEDRLGQPDRVLARGTQQKVGQAGGRFRPDSRQLGELVDQAGDRPRRGAGRR